MLECNNSLKDEEAGKKISVPGNVCAGEMKHVRTRGEEKEEMNAPGSEVGGGSCSTIATRQLGALVIAQRHASWGEILSSTAGGVL